MFNDLIQLNNNLIRDKIASLFSGNKDKVPEQYHGLFTTNTNAAQVLSQAQAAGQQVQSQIGQPLVEAYKRVQSNVTPMVGAFGQAIDEFYGLPGRVVTGFNPAVPKGFSEQVGQALEQQTGSKTLGMLGGLVAGFAEPLGGKFKAGKLLKNEKILAKIDIFTAPKNLSTKLLNKFEGMPNEITPQQFNEVVNRATKEGIRKADLDVVNSSLVKSKTGNIDLTKTAAKVEEQLVPLTPTPVKSPRYSYVGQDFIGDGEYGEIVYQSPIKTSAGDVHYPFHPHDFQGDIPRGASQEFPNYFSNVR